MDETGSNFMDILNRTKIINWRNAAFLYDCHENYIDAMMNILVPKINLPIDFIFSGTFWFLPKEKALQLEVR